MLIGAVSNAGSGGIPRCEVEICGESVPFIVDSGAVTNIISRETYELIKDNVTLAKTSKTLYAFGQSKPLKMMGQFETDLCVNSKKVRAIIFVFNGKSSNLLSASTSRALELLHIHNINSETDLESVIKSKFS